MSSQELATTVHNVLIAASLVALTCSLAITAFRLGRRAANTL